MTVPLGDPVIAVRRLTKDFGWRRAVDDIHLTVPEGSIYGFLGPNGAGKTTTIRVLLGFIRPTRGTAAIFGADCWRDGLEARRRLGYLVPPDALYLDMSAGAQLDLAARYSQRPPILRDHLLDRLDLSRSVLNQRLGSFSRGMRQKFALVAAMQGDPDLLILDEPTDGLDPLIRRSFEALLTERHAAGRTIFMSSHDLDEVERLCDRVAIVRGGKLVADEEVAELVQRRLRVWDLTFRGPVPDGIGSLPGVMQAVIDGQNAQLAVRGDPAVLMGALADLDIDDVRIGSPRLEDVFFRYYGDDAQAGAGTADPRGRP